MVAIAMRVIAIDWGEARLGIAVSDPTGTLATPHAVLHEKDKRQQIERVVAVARELGAERILVGIPLRADGAPSGTARWAEKYAQKLEAVSGLPVERVDERFSSVEAADKLREARPGRRGPAPELDAAAAAIVLQAWLDAR
jgi:putative Holliday junction resolvase